MAPSVLHFTDAFGAGVASVVDQYMSQDLGEQSLLGMRRPEITDAELIEDASRTFVGTRAALAREWTKLRRHRFDVVHAHSTIAATIARLLPHPTAALVYSPHALATNHERPLIRMLAEKVEAKLVQRTDVFAAVSAPEAEQLSQLAGNISVLTVPHSIQVTGSPVGRKDREPTVLAVGRLNHQKNPESIARLPLQAVAGRISRFMWVGEGDPRRRALLERHGWVVTGWQDRTSVRSLMSTASALVHPARYEGFPLAVVEALAMGTPVVASSLPVLSGLPGVQCYTDSTQVAVLLDALLGDDSQWSAASAQGRRYVASTLNETRQRAALVEVYRRAASHRRDHRLNQRVDVN